MIETSTDPGPGGHCPVGNRREQKDRRQNRAWSLAYGGIRPRRRWRRRIDDASNTSLDWLESELLYLSLGILVLSIADAILTLNLLQIGAIEVNLIMGALIERNEHLFAAAKMALTGFGIVLLVMHERIRVFRVLSVRNILRGFFLAYLCLFGYQMAMIHFILA